MYLPPGYTPGAMWARCATTARLSGRATATATKALLVPGPKRQCCASRARTKHLRLGWPRLNHYQMTELQPTTLDEVLELLIDCEEDRTLRAVLVGMLREMERR
jgi:hypothetical protein